MARVVVAFLGLVLAAPVAVAAAEEGPARMESLAVRPEPVGVVRRADAIAAALAGNPELREQAWDVDASDARIAYAGRYPNAEIGLVVEDVLGTGRYAGGQQAQTTLELRQPIELGGKRGARVAAAERARSMTLADVAVKRSDVVADVARRFVRVLVAQEGLRLARAETTRATQTLSAVRRRVEAGAGSVIETEKATIALERSHIATEHAEHVLLVARRELAAAWGSVDARFERAEGDLFARATVPPFETLAARLEGSPDVARATSERRLREAEAALITARRIPDVTVGGGVRRLEGPGEQSILFSVGVPLPFASRNAAAVTEARALVERSDASRVVTDVRLRTSLFGFYQELLHAEIELTALETEVLPRTERTLVASRDGFERGLVSYVELLDTARTLAEVQQERVTAAGSYQQLVIEIERLIGAPIGGGEGEAR